MLKLYIKDNTDGTIHEYGTDKHDALVLQEDGSLHYVNIQCLCGTRYPEEGYSFCREDGSIPTYEEDDSLIDIGGEYFNEKAKHGKWVSVSMGVWECSNCKETYALGFDCHPYNDCCMLYCQTCGAKMDLGEEEWNTKKK